MCNACILSRFVYIFTNKPTWLEYTEKKKTWQLWILFCPVRDIKYVEVLRSFSTDLETSNELFRSAVGLSNAGSFRSWKRENSRSNDFIGVSDQLLHSCIIIIILVYCKWPKTHWCLNFVKWGKKKRCLCLHKTPLQNVNVSSVFLINLSSIITILWLLMFVASATWSVTC